MGKLHVKVTPKELKAEVVKVGDHYTSYFWHGDDPTSGRFGCYYSKDKREIENILGRREMIMTDELRTTIVQDGEKEIDFTELKKGDKFRLYEPDGEEVKDGLGYRVFEATSNPYKKGPEWAVSYRAID